MKLACKSIKNLAAFVSFAGILLLCISLETYAQDSIYVDNPIANITVSEDFASNSFSLTDVFIDTEVASADIIKTIISNSNPSLITVSISGNTFNYSSILNQNGGATIILQGNANGRTINDTFLITVTPVDDAPYVQNPLSNIATSEDHAPLTIDLTNVFADVDNSPLFITKTVLSNTNAVLADASISGQTLTINSPANLNGSAQIVIQGISNFLTVNDTFTITVSAVDDYPDVLYIPNQTVLEGATFSSINLSGFLTEVDGNTITWGYSGNSQLTVTIAGAIATVTAPNINWFGSENIWLKATDQTGSHLADSTLVTFAVTAVDDDPYVANPISNVTVNEDAVNTVINLANVFNDIDNNPSLIEKTIFNNNNTALVSASISGNQLTLDYLDNRSGIATIQVLGTSNGRSVYDEFTVTVTAIDDRPDLSPISAQTIDEGGTFNIINLATYLTEVDNDLVQYSYKNNTNLGVQILANGNTTVTTPNVDWFGTETIRFLATDQTAGHLADSVDVVFTVNPIDDPPRVSIPLSNIVVNEDATYFSADLTMVFSDVDNNNFEIQKFFESVSNPSLVTVNVTGNLMTVNYQANQHGISNVVIRANSNGKTVTDTFNITVNAVDDAPDVLSIANQTILEGNLFQTINLPSYLQEVDGNVVQWTYSGNSQLSVSINPSSVATIQTPNADWNGAEFIRFTATDQTANHLSDYVDVIFTVTPVDDPPFVSNALSNIIVNEDALNSIVDLSLVFGDIDNQISSIIKAIASNSDPTIITPSVSGNILTITYLPNRYGVVNLVISGTSNSKTAYDTVQITVQAIDDKPDVGTIPYQSIAEGGAFANIDLSNYLTEVDGNSVTWSYHGNSALLVSIISGQTASITTPNSDWYGSETIWFVATDQTAGQLKDSIQVVFTVDPVDDAPYLANPISDLTVNEDSPNSIIPLTNEFNDIDNPINQIIKSIIIIDNPSLVTLSIASNVLTIDYLENRNGAATFVIRALSGNKYAYDTIAINVSPIDDAPAVSAIPGQTVDEGVPFTNFDLDNYITELDGDGITWSYSGNSELTVTINTQNQVTITTPDANWNGSETIRFTAADNTSGHLSSYSEAVFAVDPLDDGPYVENPLSNVTVNEDAVTSIINVSIVFNDIDNPQSSIIKTISSNSNSALVLAYTIGNSMYLDYQDNQHGTATIVVNGLSNGKSINDTLLVTVNPVDDAPVINVIDDLIVNEGDAFPTFDLDEYLNEFDGDAVTWSYSNNVALSVSIQTGNIAVVNTPNADWFGTETIRFTATDITSNHLSGFINVVCTVNPIDDAPYIQAPITDRTVNEDFGSFTIDISSTFNDIDNLHSGITYSISGNNNPALITANVAGSIITVNSILNQNGNARIIVQALSNQKTVADTFFVTVTPVDDAPVVSGIPNQHISEGAAFASIPLGNYLTEVDGNIVTWSYSNNTPLSVSINASGITTVTAPNVDWNGSVTVRFTASDNTAFLLSAYQDVTFIIDPVDDAPYVANPLSDGYYTEDNVAVDINIDNVFSDIDNLHSEFVISVYNNSNTTLLSATIAQPLLHLVFQSNQIGSAQIILNAESGGQSAKDTFNIFVSPVDDYPSLINIPNQSIDEGNSFAAINLSNYLVEFDGDALVYSYRNNNNLTVNIAGSSAMVTAPNADWFGSDTIRFVVNDQTTNQYEGYYDVIFTIDPIDDAPYVAIPLNNMTVNEDQQNIQVVLTDVFSDIDNNPSLILKTVGNISNPLLVSGSINNDTLRLTLVPNATGSATIRIDGTSNGRTVSDNFILTVQPIDDAPVVNSIPDQTINEGETFVSFDLDNYLVEYDGNTVQWTASGNTQLGVTINSNNIVSVTIPNINWNGSENMVFTATDQTAGNLQGYVIVHFAVNPVDDAPYVAVPISNVVVDEDAANSAISLANTFADIDNPVNQMILDVDNISNPLLFTASISNQILTLDYQPNMNGFATIRIRCNSNGQTITDEFNVVVRSINDPPVFTVDSVISLIEDFSPPVLVSVQAAPVPPDELSQIVRYSIVPSSVSFASVSVNQFTGQLTISSILDQTGTQVITMYANDYQSGNNIYSRTFRLTVNPKLEQQILFPEISNKTIIDAPFTISATASSGLPVMLEILSGPITLNGNLVTITGVGTASIRATQAGNASYYPASPITRTFNITRVSQTVTYVPVPDKFMTDPPFTLSATASSGLPVSYAVISGGVTLSGTTVTINSPGNVVIRVGQAGNATYNPAPTVDITFSVAKVDQTITFPAIENIAFTTEPISLNATSSSGLAVQFSLLSGNGQIINNQLVLSGTGPFIIRASQPGNTSYNAAPDVDQFFEVTKLAQTIDFPAIPDQPYNAIPFKVEATASSGLPVLLTVLSGPATISGDTVTVTGMGWVTLRAVQPGNSQYDAADDVDRTFYVGRTGQTIINFNVPQIIYLQNDPILLSAEATSGLEVEFNVIEGNASIDLSNHLIASEEGIIRVRASQAGNAYYDPAPDVDREITVVSVSMDISLVQIISPEENEELPLNQPLDITVEVKNIGTLAIAGFNIGYDIDEGLKIVDESVTDTLQPGDSITYTFDAKWTTQSGSHSICVAIEALENEANLINNEQCLDIDVITDITDYTRGATIKVYPNPTHELLNFEVSEQIKEGIIYFYDTEGKLVKTIPFGSFMNSPVITIDMSEFVQGMYFYKLVIASSDTFVGKVVKY